MSPDGARTAAAYTTATGLEVRRVRDTDTYGLMDWQGIVRTVEKRGADFRR
jgi:hypothetical protein